MIKEGLYEDMERRDQIYEIARFRTTSGEQWRSLEDYVAATQGRTRRRSTTHRRGCSERPQARRSSKVSRRATSRFCCSPIRSTASGSASALGFDGKPFKSVTQGDHGLDALPLAEQAKAEGNRADGAALATLIALFKQALGSAVSDVRATARLTASPVCLVAREQDLDRTLERLLTRQNAAGVTATAPILEINAEHPLMVALAAKAVEGGAADRIAQAAHLLLDQARILEGETPADPARFAQALVELLQRGIAAAPGE